MNLAYFCHCYFSIAVIMSDLYRSAFWPSPDPTVQWTTKAQKQEHGTKLD